MADLNATGYGPSITGSTLGTQLQELLMCDDIAPGSEASYQTCKTIYLHHPLGKKMVDSPIAMAQSQARDISVPGSPESRVRDAFKAEWKALGVDRTIANLARVARVYGVGTVVMGGGKTDAPFNGAELPGQQIFFNVLDPINTSGNGSQNQDPNAPNFQRMSAVAVQGVTYHPSRSLVLMNEDPIYISFSSSAFGFSGRSVYQRALFPLKSFVQTMLTDDLVTRKAGVIVAKMKQPGSVTDRLMTMAAALKRSILQQAKTDNVISIGHDEDIETLDLAYVKDAAGFARQNILNNVAIAADMPAVMINSETFAEGFGEGTEDAKNVARFIDGIRSDLAPAYQWFDNIVQYRAWTPEFYATIQATFPEDYGGIDYQTAFVEWRNAFRAEWPSLLIEPDSEKIKVEDVKLKAVIAAVEVLLGQMDPENKATVIEWAADAFNGNKMLFPNPLVIDMDALRSYVPPSPPAVPSEPEAFGAET